MQSIYRFKFYFQWMLLTALASPVFASTNGGQPTTYLDKVETARVIVVGRVHNVKQKKAKNGLDEKYDLVTLKGDIVDSSGTRKIKGNLFARSAPGEIDRKFLRGTYVFILPDDRSSQVLYETDSWAYTPILEINNGAVFYEGSPVVGLDSIGKILLGDRTNSCDITDAPDGRIALYSENDELEYEYTQAEYLESIDSFQCPDGTQWNRSLEDDRNGTNNLEPMTLDVLTQLLSTHLSDLSIPPVTQKEVERSPSNKPAQPQNDIEKTSFTDEFMLGMLEQSDELLQEADETFLKQVYKRVEARKALQKSSGVSFNKNRKKDGVVDWKNYPKVGKKLKSKKIMK